MEQKGVFSMGNTSENSKNKHICLGLVAHVDAGKTTLSEGMLYLSGGIRSMGRVDHGMHSLDTYELERSGDHDLLQAGGTLVERSGHHDPGYAGACGFSAEMERVLQVLDYAVLIISGADGIQGHTMTLWKLLERYQVPVFIFCK